DLRAGAAVRRQRGDQGDCGGGHRWPAGRDRRAEDDPRRAPGNAVGVVDRTSEASETATGIPGWPFPPSCDVRQWGCRLSSLHDPGEERTTYSVTSITMVSPPAPSTSPPSLVMW